MSAILHDDLDYAYATLNRKYHEEYKGIFANTNEDVLAIFDNLDVSDKNVLTVLSSSDYLIVSNLFGAKSVDCFDINPITYRYFFLRRWLIQNGYLDYGFCSYEKLTEIVNGVTDITSEEEKESLEFWRIIIEEFKNDQHWNNGLITTKFSPLYFYYEERKEEIKKIISSVNPTFYDADICSKSGFRIDKKYDYVFLSNILDWQNRTPEKLKVVKRNLLRLLNSGGSVVCTHIPSYRNSDYIKTMEPERDVFDPDFTFRIIDDEMSRCGNISYTYTRKN